MANTYIWNSKSLNSDKRGYASDIYLEMQGTSSSGKTSLAGITVSFGGSDYKPTSQWQQTDIDSLADAHQQDIKNLIDTHLAELDSKQT